MARWESRLCLCAATVGLFAGGVTTASALTAPSPTSAKIANPGVHKPQRPAECGPANAVAELGGYVEDFIACGPSTQNTTGYSFSDLTISGPNRVWLHQYANGTGWADCFSPHGEYALSGRNVAPGNFQYTTNDYNCP